jgi:hypothetical protein
MTDPGCCYRHLNSYYKTVFLRARGDGSFEFVQLISYLDQNPSVLRARLYVVWEASVATALNMEGLYIALRAMDPSHHASFSATRLSGTISIGI